jgi:hypothetical protein
MVHSRNTGSAIDVERCGSTAMLEIMLLPPAEWT